MMLLLSIPRGSKYPIFKDSGPKYHQEYGLWNQKPQILGTWTLGDTSYDNKKV